MARPIPIDTALADVPQDAHVVLRCIMNPNFSEFMEIITTRHRTDDAVTTVEDFEFGQDGCEKIVHEVSALQARAIVAKQVSRFAAEHPLPATLLAGVSGGGDSNALIVPLAEAAREQGTRLVCYTLVCDPIWPETSAERAAVLCQSAGLEHMVLGGDELGRLLRLKTDVPACFEDFLHEFGSKTAHFFATHFISLAARRLGHDLQTTDYCLGFNREDVLAEVLYCLMNGHPPLAYPVRQLGPMRLLMPIWRVPKVLLDSCYPDYSLANYEHRIGTTPQRGLIYFLAHSVDAVYNNFGLSLLTGLHDVFDGAWPELASVGRHGVLPVPWAAPEVMDRVVLFLDRHFEID